MGMNDAGQEGMGAGRGEEPGLGGQDGGASAQEPMTLSDEQRARLMSLLGLARLAAPGLGGFSEADEQRAEWDRWRVEHERGPRPLVRKVARLSRDDQERIERDGKRKMGPLRLALGRARLEGTQSAWCAAMWELAQAALESSRPEREAARIMVAARIEPMGIPSSAAAVLRKALGGERSLATDPVMDFGEVESPRGASLAKLWTGLANRASGAC